MYKTMVIDKKIQFKKLLESYDQELWKNRCRQQTNELPSNYNWEIKRLL